MADIISELTELNIFNLTHFAHKGTLQKTMQPVALDLKSYYPKDFPIEPQRPYPNGPNCSAYGGTPTLAFQAHYDDYVMKTKEYERDVLEYPEKLKDWIIKNENNESTKEFVSRHKT